MTILVYLHIKHHYFSGHTGDSGGANLLNLHTFLAIKNIILKCNLEQDLLKGK